LVSLVPREFEGELGVSGVRDEVFAVVDEENGLRKGQEGF
jgi:hypothetical protein